MLACWEATESTGLLTKVNIKFVFIYFGTLLMCTVDVLKFIIQFFAKLSTFGW